MSKTTLGDILSEITTEHHEEHSIEDVQFATIEALEASADMKDIVLTMEDMANIALTVGEYTAKYDEFLTDESYNDLVTSLSTIAIYNGMETEALTGTLTTESSDSEKKSLRDRAKDMVGGLFTKAESLLKDFLAFLNKWATKIAISLSGTEDSRKELITKLKALKTPMAIEVPTKLIGDGTSSSLAKAMSTMATYGDKYTGDAGESAQFKKLASKFGLTTSGGFYIGRGYAKLSCVMTAKDDKSAWGIFQNAYNAKNVEVVVDLGADDAGLKAVKGAKTFGEAKVNLAQIIKVLGKSKQEVQKQVDGVHKNLKDKVSALLKASAKSMDAKTLSFVSTVISSGSKLTSSIGWEFQDAREVAKAMVSAGGKGSKDKGSSDK